MGTLTWVNAAGGFWSFGPSWSSGAPPTATDSVVIGVGGAYQVALFGAGPFAAYSVSLTDPTATLALEFGAGLTLGSVLLLQAGTLELGGTISGGTIDFVGGTLIPSLADGLAGVALEGTAAIGGGLQLPTYNSLQILSGPAGAGVLDLQGAGLAIENTQTISGGSVLLDATAYTVPSISVAGGTLTLAQNVTLIAQGLFGGSLTGNVTSDGLVQVLPGRVLSIGGGGSSGIFVNAGTITVAAGGTLALAGPFQNSGTVQDNGATVLLEGSVTPAELAAVASQGATVELMGMLNEAAGTLGLGGTGLQNLILAGGTILNGIVAMQPGAMLQAAYSFTPDVLSGVTLQGSETLGAAAPAALAVTNGLSLAGAGGTGSGTLTIAGLLGFVGPEAVSGGTIQLSQASTLAATGGQLTLAAGTMLQTVPAVAASLTGNILNLGTVLVTAGSSLAVGTGGTFANAGGLTVAPGATLLLTGAVANTGSTSIGGAVVAVGSQGAAQLLADRTALTAPLTLAGTLINTGSTLAVGAGSALGTLTLAPGGGIVGGLIADSGGGLLATGGTVSALSYRGTLQAISGTLAVVNGLSLQSPGAGLGAISVAPGATLALLDQETIDNAAILLGGTLSGALSLGAHGTLTHAGRSAQILGSLANAGLVTAAVPSGVMSIATLSNTGTVSVSAGDVLAISTLANAGTVAVANGGALSLNALTGNASGISVSNATLNLLGPIALPTLAAISRAGGIVNLEGTLSLGGGTLSVGAGTALGQLRNDAHDIITGGTIRDSGSGLIFVGPLGQGGTLNGVYYQGTLNLVPSGSTVTVTGGTSFTDITGTTRGTINLLGAASYLGLLGPQTLNNVQINMGNGFSAVELAVADASIAGGAAVTLGASSTVTTWGALSSIAVARGLDDSLLDQGLLSVTGAASRLLVQGGTFTAAGTVVIGNASTLSIQTDAIGNLSGGTLSGGNWQVLAGSTLDLGYANPVSTLTTSMYLSGPGSQVEYFDLGTYQETTIDQTLRAVGSGGTLLIVNGRSFADPGSLSVTGRITVVGGTVLAAPLTVAAGGVVSGAGVIGSSTGNVYDSGIILGRGGQLTINGSILPGPSGFGSVWINVDGTLAVSGQEADPVWFIGASGELILSQPALMSGQISGFTGADLIDLTNVGTAGLSLSYASNGNSGVLTVRSGTVVMASLQFLGAYVTQNFTFMPDGHGGTLIEDPPAPAALIFNGHSLTPGDLPSLPSQPSASGGTAAGTIALAVPAGPVLDQPAGQTATGLLTPHGA
ncbi:MAG TPA: hypothetical protein VFA03_16770 [Acetobacteraceae bacterium]|nr:hypothetical protein [Acetobacteraceae bacterium]